MNIQAHAYIGGKSVGEDIRKLEYRVHVVSGTPSRVCDMIKRMNLMRFLAEASRIKYMMFIDICRLSFKSLFLSTPISFLLSLSFLPFPFYPLPSLQGNADNC
ncbi:hypothetical protein Dimus_007552 [Dionaea muscipula]